MKKWEHPTTPIEEAEQIVSLWSDARFQTFLKELERRKKAMVDPNSETSLLCVRNTPAMDAYFKGGFKILEDIEGMIDEYKEYFNAMEKETEDET